MNLKTIAYSLWLNDLDASKGNLLFGAIDTEKYHGDLARLDLLSNGNQVVEFSVALTSVAGYSSTGSDSFSSSSFPITALLDSGTTLSYLPTDIAQQIWEEVGAAYVSSIKLAVVPCAYATSKAYFSFGFGGSDGPRINVTMDELVLDQAGVTMSNGRHKSVPACTFGIQAQSSSSDGSSNTYLLGDTFMRSAYVVYDLENNQVAIAPTKFNASASNVVPFGSKGATIPSSTPVPGANTTQSGSSGTSSAPDYEASPGFQEENGAATIGLSALGLVAVSMSTFFAIFASAF